MLMVPVSLSRCDAWETKCPRRGLGLMNRCRLGADTGSRALLHRLSPAPAIPRQQPLHLCTFMLPHPFHPSSISPSHIVTSSPLPCPQVRITPLTTKKFEHQGIRVQLIGQIELASERGSPHDFVSLGERPGAHGPGFDPCCTNAVSYAVCVRTVRKVASTTPGWLGGVGLPPGRRRLRGS